MLSATIAYLLLAAQGQPLVTVRLEAEPAERLLPKLGKIMNLELKADASTKNDVIVIAVKDVKRKDLMDRIAKLTCAGWEKDDNGILILKRTKDKENAQEKEEARYRQMAVQGSKSELAEKLKKMAVTNVQQADEAVVEMADNFKSRRDPSLNPNGRIYESRAPHEMLVRRIALAIPDSVYANIAPDNNIVFSDKPTKAQTLLPVNMGPIYQAYMAESKLFKAVSSNPAFASINMPSYILLGTQSNGDAPKKIRVRIMPEENNSYSVRCRIVGSDDIDDVHFSLTGRVQYYSGPQRKSAKLLDAVPVTCKELLLTLRNNPLKDSLPNVIAYVSDGCLKRYFDPVNNEPLAAFHGGVLMASADEQNLNLVAVLSDKMLSFAPRIFRQLPETVQEAERLLDMPTQRSMPDLQCRADAGWLEARPVQPSDLWNIKIGRAVYKQQIGVYDMAAPCLDVMASLAYNLPPYYGSCLPIIPVRLSAYGMPRQMTYLYHYPKLRFWGSLLPPQKAMLLKGQRLRLGSLSPVQIAMLNPLVYLSMNQVQQIRFEFEDDNIPDPQTSGFEATEVLPNGLTQNMELGASIGDEDRVNVTFENGTSVLLDMSGLATELLNQEAGSQSERGAIRYLQVKKVRVLTATVYFGPGAKGDIEYPEEVLNSQTKVDNIAKLPAAIQKQIEEQKAELLKPKKAGKRPVEVRG